jgi:hypothetical protein
MSAERCASVYGPEQVRCIYYTDETHEWHAGSGINPEDGEVYGAAWLSHWEPGLTDRPSPAVVRGDRHQEREAR